MSISNSLSHLRLALNITEQLQEDELRRNELLLAYLEQQRVELPQMIYYTNELRQAGTSEENPAQAISRIMTEVQRKVDAGELSAEAAETINGFGTAILHVITYASAALNSRNN